MQIEILGSGGAIATPRPGCDCRVCTEAREKGPPHSRCGPSTFVHGPDILFDTPEEIRLQLDRSRVTNINACFYSHWHPDHVMGRRVWESLNQDTRGRPLRNQRTRVYLPKQVALDFRTMLGGWDHLAFLEQRGAIHVIELSDEETVTIGGYSVRPFRLAEDYVYAFLIEGDGKRVLIAPDELNGWTPPEWVRGLDLAVVPLGVVEHDPFTGERRIAADHPILELEATYAETLVIARALDARHVVFSHIEEPDELTYDDLLKLRAGLRRDGLHATFAHDTMLIDVP